MKYKLLLVMLFFPILVFAEDYEKKYNTVLSDFNFLKEISNDIYYSESVIYENNVYYLEGNLQNEPLRRHVFSNSNPDKVIYTCLGSASENSCEIVYAIYTKNEGICINISSYNCLIGIGLKNGQMLENVEKYYIANDYKKIDGKYQLIEYQEHHLSEVNRTTYFSSNFSNKYLCLNMENGFCENVYYLIPGGVHSNAGENVSDSILVGNDYYYDNGKYFLVDEEKILPSVTELPNPVYTCGNDENSCTKLYAVTSNSIINYYRYSREYYFSELNPRKEEETIEIVLGDEVDLNNYFDADLLQKLIVNSKTNYYLKGNVLSANEAGRIDVYYNSRDYYKVVHVVVNSVIPESSKNPNTSDIVLIICILMIGSFVLMILFCNKRKLLI